MKVAIIGCGYVGLITGLGLASKNHSVTAIDVDVARVEKINSGMVPFYEPGVTEALRRHLKVGNFHASGAIDDVTQSEVIIICVQTPPQSNGAMNLKILESAARQLAEVFKKNLQNRIVVVKSTTVPGTTDNLISPIFKNTGTEIAFNPEFLREGSALDDFVYPDRIVIGTHASKAARILSRMYAPFNAPIIKTTPSTAELAKYTSNCLLATLVSFSNEIAGICEQTPGADIEDVLGIVHWDRRFALSDKVGSRAAILSYLKAGCGFGGSCLPKDLSALIAYARSRSEKAPLLKAVAEINAGQAQRVVEMTKEALKGLDKRKVAVLGVAFKGGTDDLRESPGLRIIDELLKRGVEVTAFDPLVKQEALKGYQNRGVTIASTLKSAVEEADACIISSNAPQFNKLKKWIKQKNNLVIIDGRRIIKAPKDLEKWYWAVGLSKKSIYKS